MSELSFIQNTSRGKDAIIFIHGGGIGARMWAKPLETLSEFHCLAPDLPRHGASKDIAPFSLDLSVERVAQLIRDQTLKQKARVAAISVGVSIAVALANRHPSLVEALFLSGPTPKMSQGVARFANFVSRPILSMFGPAQRTKMTAQMLGMTDEQVRDFRADFAQITPDLVAEINQVVASQEEPIAGNIPVELFSAEGDIGATKKRCAELVHAYGNDGYYLVSGHRHAWPLENPDLFVETIRLWTANKLTESRFERIKG